MKQLNFLSSLGSQSMGLRVTTLALTVGSPSAHRRSTMLKLLSVLVLVLTFGVGNVWGALSSPYTCTFTSDMSMSGSNCTTGDVTWTISTTTGKGSPSIEFGKQNTQSCIKFGSGQKKYYSKMTLTTSAFSAYNVSSVVIYASSNNGGSKTFKVTQGETEIGTGSQSFSSTTWVTNITRNTTAGSGGDLSIEISSDATATFVHSIKVTYSAASCTTKPTVGSSLTSVSATVNSITATVPISAIGGCNITENGLVYSTSVATPTVGAANCTKVTTTACGGTAANKEVTITGLACGTTYYVRGYATNSSGTSYTNVKTQATSACPIYTVTLMDDSDTRTQGSYGAAVTLPSRAGCTGYTFAGWTKSWVTAQSSWTSTAPTIISAGSYTPAGNENLYPVYTKTEAGSGFSSYTKVTSAPSDWSGKYLISDGTSTATGAQFSSTALAITTLTPGTTEYTAYEFTITKNGNNNNYFIISPDGTYYVGYDSSTNLKFSDNPNTNAYLWTCQTSDPMILNVATTTRYIGVGTESKTDVFKAYSTSGTNAKCYLYKRIEGGSTTYYISVPNCCTPLGSINGSILMSQQKQRSLTLEWDKLSGVDGTTPYTITCKQGSSDAGTIGDIDLSGEKATCTVTGLDCSTTYTFTITAHGDASHCDRTQEDIQGTTAGAYVAPALNYSSTALTVGGSTASPSWATAPTHTGTLSYASSNPAVITVNSSTGVVTPVGAGTAHVIASWAQSADYCAATKNSVDITVTGNVSVSFNANGGGGTMANQSIPVSTPTELKENEFTTPSSCQYFYGWATSKENADAGTRAYENGQSVTINAGMELFAIWKTYNYTVTKGTNEGAATFTLPANVDCGGTISITCAADGTHKGNPTITATEGKYSAINVLSATSAEITGVSGDITVNISYAAKENYSITWKVNGEALTGSALTGVTTDVLEGASITNLPAAPAGLDCAATFMGWSADEIGLTPLDKDDETDATRIAALGLFKNAASAPAIDGNKTFHAVFATGSSTNASLTQMVYEDDFAAGDKIVIIAENLQYGLYQESSSNYVSYWTTADNGGVPSINEIEADSKRYLDVAEGTADGTWKLGDGTIGYLYNSSSTYMAFSTENASDFTLTSWSDGTFTLEATQKLACRNDLTAGNQYKWRGSGANCDLTQGTGCSGTPSYNIYKYVEAGSSFNNYVTKCCKTWSDPTVTYNTYALVAGGDHATVTITGDQKGLTPTYSSSNTNVITVDAATGEVTPVGAGSATVTVTWAAANDYCEKVITSSAFTVTGVAVITFKLNGGSVAGDAEKTQEVTTGEDATLTSLATLGYVAPSCKQFGGWAASEEDANAVTPVVFKADGATINVSEATNLWAIWNTKTFAVTDGTIDASVASYSYSANPITCGSDLTITCASTNAYKGNPTVTATGTHGAITVNSATSVTIANVQSAIAVSIAYETAKATYDITWKVGGQAYTPAATDPSKQNGTATLLEGDNLVLPSAPADNKLGCANKFMGWSTHDYKSVKKTASDYSDLFTATSGAPEITEATTFYAVFATQNSTPLVEHEMSFSRSGSDDTYTTGYTFSTSGTSAKTGYYQDNSGTVTLKLYHTSNAFFTSAPANLSFTANIGAGSNNLDFANPVYARLLNQSGEGIGNAIEITSHITSQSGDTYTPTLDLTGITSAYGIMLYHEKESGQNIRYYSFSLSYTTGGTTTTDYVTECAAVEAPTFSVDPAEGPFNEAQSVTITSETDGAKVYYTKTTDGSTPADPTASSTEATSAITVDQNTKIKAIAIKGDDKSAIVPAEYTFKVATPTISGNTSFVSSATVTITAAEGTSIYYTTNGNEPTTGSTPYTIPFTVDADGTTTVKAIAVKSNWTSSEIASQAFTKITPLTVTQANTAVAALGDNGTIPNQFVIGLISQIDQFNSGDNTITYWISVDGSTTAQLEVYHGSAGVANGGNAFTAATNLKVGEEVVVSGTLMKYKKGTNNYVYEFVNPNEIVAYKTHSPITWSAGACTAELNGEENEYPTLSGTTGLTISYESTNEGTATIDANGVVTPVDVGSTTIKATSAANSSYVATTVSYALTVSPTVTKVDLDIECNGATSGCPETTHLVKQTNLPDPLPAVAKAGKNFGGWYTDNTFETPAVAGASITENTTIYAQWLDPYTVAEALTIISGLGANNANTISTEYYYVAGVVTNDAVSVSSNTATYKIQDAGESNELTVYKGKGLDNVNVTEASQIQEADEVVVYGLLQNYYGTAQIAQGNYIHSQVRPTYDVTGVTVSPTAANIRAGKTVALTATITPSYATNKNVTWSVKSGDAYAEVSATGVVTGLAAGTAVIEVETEDGEFTATCTVTVAGALPTFTEDDHEWIKISNASKLVAGRFYVIGESSKGVTATNDLSSGYLAKASTTITDGVIASGTLGTNTAIFELGGNASDGWTLYELMDEENTGYLSGTNTSSLSWSASAATTSISFDESGNAILGNANGYRVLYNSSSPRFKGYDSNTSASMLLPQLYMWAELSHSVTFDANGGVAESVPGVERTDEGSIIIPATTPTHSDISKAFGGWYKSDAPATLYNAGDEFETNVDVTLYAKWNTVPTYTVTYVPGGTGTVPAVASYREGQKVQVEEASLSNPGYSFAGWTVKDAEQNVLPLDEENKFEMPASNVTITAVWSRISSQKWNLVKHGESLEIDGEYVIVYHNGATQKALGAISSSIGTAINVTIDGEILKGSDAMKVLTLKEGKGGENYAFQSGDNYLSWSSGNSLNESDELNDASSWIIEIDENNVATISNVGTEARKLQYNTGSPRFACYTGTQKNVQLYKKAASVVIEDEQTVNTADIAANADVTVKDGGTLNVDAAKSIGDLTVEAGGKVVLDENKLTVVGTFTLETTMASGASGQLTGATASNFATNGPAYIDITLGDNGNPEKWHAFTVPFPVDAINGIYDLDGNKLNNEEHYAIMEYLGNVRAQGKYGWKKYRKTLVPGTFYLMTVDGGRTTYRFMKTADGALVAGNSKDVYEYAASGEGQSTDAGWNGVGNPTLVYGKVNAEVQVLDPVSYTYIKKDPNSTNFVVGTPFFYQADGAGSISMLTADAGANYAPARVATNGIEKIKVSFGNEEFTDYLDISASEEALNEYQIGKDLVKMTMTNAPSVAQIFGNAYNAKLCMVYAPMVNDKATFDLTLYAPAAGTYTIAAPSMENATLYLTKNGRIYWNLTMGACELDLNQGQNNEYGLILRAKAPQVTTGVENGELLNGENGVQKVVIDEHVYILRGGEMYDMTGKMVK